MMYNTKTQELSDKTEMGLDWITVLDKPNTSCCLGDDLTWQPPSPIFQEKYNWDSVNLMWIKR